MSNAEAKTLNELWDEHKAKTGKDGGFKARNTHWREGLHAEITSRDADVYYGVDSLGEELIVLRPEHAPERLGPGRDWVFIYDN